MIVNIQDDILKLHAFRLLDRLLVDKTTKKNIMWATDAYVAFGARYERNEEITSDLITGANSHIIKTRARKAMEQQASRTKQRGEVFTPLWICKMMNDHMDEMWCAEKENDWKQYVDARRLEITCGEAPYLVSRYDVETGEAIPVSDRIGLLDRKLQMVNEHTQDETEWMEWAIRAFQSTYGYEFQGDNVLIARVNLLMTFEEHLGERWNRKPTVAEYQKVINIITWNIWQMDGLTGTIPYRRAEDTFPQLDFFDVFGFASEEQEEDEQPHCLVYNWRGKCSVEYLSLPTRGKQAMKFDFVIGNPPYQEETTGDAGRGNLPIYPYFMDAAYELSDRVELITPARFLFNAGAAKKTWNDKMLADPHLKVLLYQSDSSKVFPNTDIKGGIAITYRDAQCDFGAIETFTAFEELNSILHRVINAAGFKPLSEIVNSRTEYRLTALMHQEHPEAINMLSKGHLYDMSSNIFELLPQIFFDIAPEDEHTYVRILGRNKDGRIYKYVRRDYINNVVNFENYKVFVPQANGSGALGEVITTPVIGQPVIGHTETFISIGNFEKAEYAESCMRYIKSKFARVLLGILKVTQNNPPAVWRYVPLQDFTSASDIDWSKSISEIDQQLYAKYGLDGKEIEFIETHVKEME